MTDPFKFKLNNEILITVKYKQTNVQGPRHESYTWKLAYKPLGLHKFLMGFEWVYKHDK